jgi:hypothetical protein
MRIAWATLGRIIARVVAEREALTDPLGGLRRIGIDEISYRKGQKYLTVVVDHASDRLIWAAPGRDNKTLATFFDLLGPQRCTQVRLVSADAAEPIAAVVTQRSPQRDVVPRPLPHRPMSHRRPGRPPPPGLERRPPRGTQALAGDLKGARWARWRNPPGPHREAAVEAVGHPVRPTTGATAPI